MKLENTVTVAKYAEGDFAEYRIPALAVLESGTVIAAYESRRGGLGDWAETWITLRRSADGGRTFEAPVYPHQRIRDAQARKTVTWNNPVLIPDGDLLHLIFHGDYASAWYCRSEDDGRTFSVPVEITDCFLDFPMYWNVCASGPGHGTADASGRLVVPVWLAAGKMRLDLEPGGRIREHLPSVAGCILSDDRGRTWRPGFLTEGLENASETTVTQLHDGGYLFNFRNAGPKQCRILGIAGRDLERLIRVWPEESLPDPQCMGGMAAKDGTIYFVNCAYADPQKRWGPRVHLSVSASMDEGKSWERILTVDEIGGYADIGLSDDGFYIFYERIVNGRVQELVCKRYSA